MEVLNNKRVISKAALKENVAEVVSVMNEGFAFYHVTKIGFYDYLLRIGGFTSNEQYYYCLLNLNCNIPRRAANIGKMATALVAYIKNVSHDEVAFNTEQQYLSRIASRDFIRWLKSELK